jgi:hypothetical protein
MSNSSYLPSKEADLVDWADNFVTVLTAHATAWQVPADEVTALTAALNAFKPLHEQAAGPDSTAVIVEQKNEAKAALVTLIRNMVNYRLANPAVVNNAARVELGLHVKDTNPTPVGPPTTAPEIELTFPGIRRIDVHFKDESSSSKARPAGTNGAVVFWEFSETPITDLNALSHSALATKTPYRFEFGEADRGKRIYVALRWQSSRGDRGPASSIESAAVP